jgi:hypothetical protein
MSIWLALLLVGAVLIYVIAKVISNMRQSEKDWQGVDKTKLKKWEDDEDD